MVCLCNLAFAKHVPSADAGQLIGDPTTCYQSPERLRACHSHTAAIERGAGRGAGASLGAGAGADAGTGLAGGGGGGGSSSSSSSSTSGGVFQDEAEMTKEPESARMTRDNPAASHSHMSHLLW